MVGNASGAPCQVDAELQARRNLISQAWDGFGGYLEGLAVRYDRAFATALETRRAQIAAGVGSRESV